MDHQQKPQSSLLIQERKLPIHGPQYWLLFLYTYSASDQLALPMDLSEAPPVTKLAQPYQQRKMKKQ